MVNRDGAIASNGVRPGDAMTIPSGFPGRSTLTVRFSGRAAPHVASRWLPAAAPATAPGVPIPDLADPVPVHGSDDEVWMLSYMDIMTLLLTLFVLLFVYTQAVAPTSVAADRAQGGAQWAEAEQAVPRGAGAAAVASLQPDLPIALPPQWLGSLVEPPIPELMVRFGDAADGPGIVGAAVVASEASVNGELAPVGTVADSGLATEKPAPEEGDGRMARPDAEATRVAGADRTSGESPSVASGTADQQSAVAVDTPRLSTPAPVTTSEAPAPPGRMEQALLAAIEASELGRRVEVTRRQDAINLEIGAEILFDRGSATLNAGGEALLAELAKLLGQQAVTVSVEGHTDDAPIRNARFASNWELSAARATTVTRQLIAHAVDPTRVRAVGHADTRPRADNATAEGRARNRRVSLVLHVPTAILPTSGNAAAR